MRNKIIAVAGTVAGLMLSTSASAAAVTGTSMFGINDGAQIDGTRADQQSDYAQEFAISSDSMMFMGAEWHFGEIALGDIPVVGGLFEFLYDSQETGGNPAVTIDDLMLVVRGAPDVIVFDFDDVGFGPMELDGTTDSPLGNGADMGFYVPVSLFEGMGFDGNTMLTFLWQQSNDDNGFDEWVTVGEGSFIGDEVPLPGALPLMASVIFGGGALRRLRRR